MSADRFRHGGLGCLRLGRIHLIFRCLSGQPAIARSRRLGVRRCRTRGRASLHHVAAGRTVEDSIAAGSRLLSAPATNSRGEYRFAYIADPEGNLIELVSPVPLDQAPRGKLRAGLSREVNLIGPTARADRALLRGRYEFVRIAEGHFARRVDAGDLLRVEGQVAGGQIVD